MDNAFFLTLRCSPLETQLFEDAAHLILSEFRCARTCSYAYEKDGTPDVHLHLLVKTPSRDASHFKQVFLKKKFHSVVVLFKSKNTETNQYALDIKSIKDDDYQQTLGYIYKEQFCERRSTTHDSPYLTEAIKLYHSNKRIEERNIPLSKKILLNPKNFHSHLENFLAKNTQSSILDWRKLKSQMVIANYSFMDISDKKLSIAINELQHCEDDTIELLNSEDLETTQTYNQHYDANYYKEFCPDDLKLADVKIDQWKRQNKQYLYKYI